MTESKQEIKAFYEIPISDYVEPMLHQIILEAGIPWKEYYQFKVKDISNIILCRDPFFKWLLSCYKFKAGILRISPNTCYDWHKDTDRYVSIAMLLNKSVHHSHCLFSLERKFDKRLEKPDPITHEFIELEYKPARRYVLNNQVDHTVLNFEDSYRYLFSIEFEEQLTYDNFLTFLEKNKKYWKI